MIEIKSIGFQIEIHWILLRIQWIRDRNPVDSVIEMNAFDLDPLDSNSGKKASEVEVDLPAIEMEISLLTARDSSPTITALLP